jgi:hypothetical protein
MSTVLDVELNVPKSKEALEQMLDASRYTAKAKVSIKKSFFDEMS